MSGTTRRRTRFEPRNREWWVRCDQGHEHYGEHGAAGLLLVHEGHYLLQHRPRWADHGGTWGIPGGAVGVDETYLDAAIREALEEGVAPFQPLPGADTQAFLADHGGWGYFTVVTQVAQRPETVLTPESRNWVWLPKDQVSPVLNPAFAPSLHPGFAAFLEHHWDDLP